MDNITPYNEEWPTCSYTHVWLRVMDAHLDPDEITRLLGIPPTETVLAGERHSPTSKHRYKAAGWFLSTEDILTSRDARHHFDWLLERVGTKSAEFATLLSRGYRIDICCRWDSSSGQGGLALTPVQMSLLGQLGLEVWFDIYFDDPVDRTSPNQAMQRTAPRSDA